MGDMAGITDLDEDKVWTTKQGEEIRVGDMDLNHLYNAYHFVKRRDDEWVELPYPMFQGEMAQEFAEADFFEAMDRHSALISWRETFTRELERRGVTV